jgi:hypothetical protein
VGKKNFGKEGEPTAEITKNVPRLQELGRQWDDAVPKIASLAYPPQSRQASTRRNSDQFRCEWKNLGLPCKRDCGCGGFAWATREAPADFALSTILRAASESILFVRTCSITTTAVAA